MRSRIIAGVAAASMLFVAAGNTDPSVTASATRDGGTATVSGAAIFDQFDGAFDVGGTKTDFADQGAAAALGIDLVGAEIEVTATGVNFTWHVEDLPEVVPPEGVRYTWAFNANGRSYQLQAKTSNLVSVTTSEDPVGHANQTANGGEWFQLRGACQASYAGTPASGCYHLAFLDGSFDAANDTVTMTMPWETRDSIGRLVAEGFVPGVAIIGEETAGSSITATLQAGVSNTTTESFINGWDTVYTGPTVAAFAGRSGQTSPPFGVSWTSLDLNADGTFSGTVSGLSSTNNTIIIRACNVTTCVTTEVAPS